MRILLVQKFDNTLNSEEPTVESSEQHFVQPIDLKLREQDLDRVDNIGAGKLIGYSPIAGKSYFVLLVLRKSY